MRNNTSRNVRNLIGASLLGLLLVGAALVSKKYPSKPDLPPVYLVGIGNSKSVQIFPKENSTNNATVAEGSIKTPTGKIDSAKKSQTEGSQAPNSDKLNDSVLENVNDNDLPPEVLEQIAALKSIPGAYGAARARLKQTVNGRFVPSPQDLEAWGQTDKNTVASEQTDSPQHTNSQPTEPITPPTSDQSQDPYQALRELNPNTQNLHDSSEYFKQVGSAGN